MKITILGTGALACLFGWRLAQLAEHDVCLLGTWREGIDAINRNGIQVEANGDRSIVRAQATAETGSAAGAELALLTVKSWQTARAAQQAAEALGRDGLALTLQNGLGNFEQLAAAVGAGRAALGVTTQGAALLAPGHIRYAGGGDTHLGFTPETRGHVRAAAALFNQAGFPTTPTENLEAVLWGKLIANAGINPLTAILRVLNGALLERAETDSLMIAAARETAAVAAARNIALPFDPAARVRAVARATAANRSSMLQDIERGAPTEIDAINGAVVRAGEQLGVPTPVNEVLWKLVRAMREA